MSSAGRWIGLLLSIAVTAVVWRVAWVSEDCFITFRYVENTFAGLGPVFNAGEAVQGYTHPLWFGLLLVVRLFATDLVAIAIGLGLVFTAATQFWMARTAYRLSGSTPQGGLFAATFAFFCMASPSWISFQTSGLENSLSHFILVVLAGEIALHRLRRPFAISLLGTLLVLNRPDTAIFLAPIAIVLLPRTRDPAVARSIVLGALPLFAWLGFAFYYYGGITPNTAIAKLGIFPTTWDALKQGALYVGDWVKHEPLPAFLFFALLVDLLIRARDAATRAFSAGIVAQLAYVLWVGGDFMRGRFLLPTFIATLAFGLFNLAIDLRERRLPVQLGPGLVAFGLLAIIIIPGVDPSRGLTVPPSGIVNERLFYRGYHLAAIRRNGEIRNPYLDLHFAKRLRSYADACDGVTVHLRNPGTMGYLVGPKVRVIDMLGLTDATIARLPNEKLIHSPPRVGHPDKYVPIRYLAERGDIAFLEKWQLAVADRDCSFKEHPAAYFDSTKDWRPGLRLPPVPAKEAN